MCEHLNFGAAVDVHRLTDEAGKVRSFMADVTIRCADCGRPFQFLGLPAGVDTGGSSMSPDALEARLAIVPEGEAVSPLGRIAAAFAPEARH